jgi:ribosomal protein S12 methylthiotransferase
VSPKPTENGDSCRVPRLALISLGCSKNLVDSEILLGLANQRGWQIVEDPAQAELIVVNTCAFIQPAKEEAIDTILEMAQLKEAGSCHTLVVAGCMAQRYGKELAVEMPEVDRFIGTGDLMEFARILEGKSSKRVSAVRPIFLPLHTTPRMLATPFYTANVKIADGCSTVCAFCAIPKIRGPQKSRAVDDIIAETQSLLSIGVRELCLIAQDTSAYGEDRDDGATLVSLLRQPELAEGSHWVRVHYLYPSRVSDELLGAMRDAPAVLPYIDLPVQHIDDGVLKTMRRKHNEAYTRAIIERIREHLPDAVLRTSLLVGHPGETDAAFEKLCEFVTETGFDHLGVFTYSQEEGTVSAKLPDSIPEEVKQARRDIIMDLQRAQSKRKLKSLVGKTLDVLVTGPSEEHDLLWAGRWWGQAAEIDGLTYLTDGQAQIGDIVPVRITRSHDYDLEGRILKRRRR